MKELLEKASQLNINLEKQQEIERRISMVEIDLSDLNKQLEVLKKEENNLISKIETKVKQGIDIDDEK